MRRMKNWSPRKRALYALECHRRGEFWRDYDQCFEQGDGDTVARLFWEIAELRGLPVDERHAPTRPTWTQPPLFPVEVVTQDAQRSMF
jgi:hypothetical protein